MSSVRLASLHVDAPLTVDAPDTFKWDGAADVVVVGLGGAGVAAALESSFEQGATKAVLQVEASNAIAIGVYEALGFNFHHEYSFLELK
jgi:3-oxo-5alpha-steroid 4-dehydrogenase